MQRTLILFLLEGVLGYVVQHFAFVIGMHGVAKHKIAWWRVIFVSVSCATVLYLIRKLPMLQFGVHTMLNCLVTNAMCILICKMDVRKSVLGSVIMMILILLSDLVNFGVASTYMDVSEISTFLQDPINKAFSALPGNFTVLLVGSIMYKVRMRKVRGTDAQN